MIAQAVYFGYVLVDIGHPSDTFAAESTSGVNGPHQDNHTDRLDRTHGPFVQTGRASGLYKSYIVGRYGVTLF